MLGAKRQRTWFSCRLSADWQVFADAAAAWHNLF